MDYVSTYKPSHFLVNVLLKKCSYLAYEEVIMAIVEETYLRVQAWMLSYVQFFVALECKILHEKWKWRCSVVPDSLWPYGLWPAGLLCLWDFPGKNTGVSCHVLLQGIFPTQGLNSVLPPCRQTLYHLSHQGIPLYYILCRELGLALEVLHLDLLKSSLQQELQYAVGVKV